VLPLATRVLVPVLFWAPGVSGQTVPATGTAVPELVAYDRAAADLMTRWQIPGGAVAVARQGRLIFARGYGLADREANRPAEPDSLFRLSSLSKPFTAAAILRLVEEGRLTLDARAFQILDHIKPPPGATVDPRIGAITVRHLLQHTAGWDRDATFDPMFAPGSRRAVDEMRASLPPTCELIIRWMLGRRLDFDPGTRFAYSNLGFCVAGRVIEKVTRQKYDDAVRQLVLEPAGIRRMRLAGTTLGERVTGEVRYYDYPGAPPAASLLPGVTAPVPRPYGGANVRETRDSHGGWIASPIDVLRFVNGLTGVGRSIFRQPDTARLLETRPDPPVQVRPGVYYGLGWFVQQGDGGSVWSHTGGSPGASSLVVRARDGVVWAALFNGRPQSVGPFEQDLSDALWTAHRQVTTWPDHDLFGEYR
jgi:N-acyl-D-amino-acid deacylase